MGPNGAVGLWSMVLLAVEKQVKYVVEAVFKLQRERYRCIEAKPEIVADFDETIEVRLLAKLIFSSLKY
jgi:hypothetical protein